MNSYRPRQHHTDDRVIANEVEGGRRQ
jgi:hypothetical protein